MGKTPEQDKGCKASQMAEDHANLRCPEQGSEFIVWCMCKEDFLAGYQAAKDQVADADKVMPQWISVKDRLPKTNELCIVNTEWRGIVPATYGNESWIFDEGQGWSEKPLSYALYWMPLPNPPKDE